MATDPEARASGNSGMIIAVVALILVVGLAVAFMSMRGNEGTTTVVAPPSTSSTTVIDAPDAAPAPAPAPNVTVVTPPGDSPAQSEGASSDTADSGSGDAAPSAPAGNE